MAGRIIGLLVCLLCGAPLFLLARSLRDTQTPIPFWAGDETLKHRLRDIAGYNREMARLYTRCAAVFAAAGLCWALVPPVGAALLALACTAGLGLVWRRYKHIVARYS